MTDIETSDNERSFSDDESDFYKPDSSQFDKRTDIQVQCSEYVESIPSRAYNFLIGPDWGNRKPSSIEIVIAEVRRMLVAINSLTSFKPLFE